MSYYEKELEAQIISRHKGRPIAVFTELSSDVIKAALELALFVRPVFLVTEAAFRAALADNAEIESEAGEFLISEAAFVNIGDRRELVKEFAADYQKFCREKQCFVSFEQAEQTVSKPGLFGIMAVRFGYADIVLGGMEQEPHQYGSHVRQLLSLDNNCISMGMALPEDPASLGMLLFADIGKSRTASAEELSDTAWDSAGVIRELLPPVSKINIVFIAGGYGLGTESEAEAITIQAAAAFASAAVRRLAEDARKYENTVYAGSICLEEYFKWKEGGFNILQLPASLARRGFDVNAPCLFVSPSFDIVHALYREMTFNREILTGSVLCGVGAQAVDMLGHGNAASLALSAKLLLCRLLSRPHYFLCKSGVFFPERHLAVIETDSISTTVSICRGNEAVFTKRIVHGEELAPYKDAAVSAQIDMRLDRALEALENSKTALELIEGVVCGCSIIGPVSSGVYRVNQALYDETYRGDWGEYAENLGILVGKNIADTLQVEAYIVNPDTVDESSPLAGTVGLKGVHRRCIGKALPMLYACRRYAFTQRTFWEKLNLLCAHIGGQVSLAAFKRGFYVDGSNILDGDGPFGLTSCGSLPTGAIVDICFSGQYTHGQLQDLYRSEGGLKSLLGVSDIAGAEKMYAEGSPEAVKALESMAYGIAKGISSLWPSFEGEKVSGIILLGPGAAGDNLVKQIKRFLQGSGVNIAVYADSSELEAMTDGVGRALKGRAPVKNYVCPLRMK